MPSTTAILPAVMLCPCIRGRAPPRLLARAGLEEEGPASPAPSDDGSVIDQGSAADAGGRMHVPMISANAQAQRTARGGDRDTGSRPGTRGNIDDGPSHSGASGRLGEARGTVTVWVADRKDRTARRSLHMLAPAKYFHRTRHAHRVAMLVPLQAMAAWRTMT